MADTLKTYSFDSTAESFSWTLTSGGGTAAWTGSYGTPSAGCLLVATDTGRNKTIAGTFKLSTTWEGMGVTSGNAVSSVQLDDIYSKAGVAGWVGDTDISVSVALDIFASGTSTSVFSSGQLFSRSAVNTQDGSWVQGGPSSDLSVLSSYQASNTAIDIVLTYNLIGDNNASGYCDIGVDYINFSITNEAGATPTTINLTPGAITITGQDVKTNKEVQLYTTALSLNAGELSLDKTFKLSPAQLSLTGSDLSIDATEWFDWSETWSFTTAASGGTTIDLSPGSITITGQALLSNTAIDLDSGTLSLTGQSLDIDRKVNLSSGSIALTGSDILWNKVLKLDSSTVSLTGAELKVNRTLQLDASAINLSGQGLTLDKQIHLNEGSISLTGQPLNYTADSFVYLSAGSLALTQQALLLHKAVHLDNGAIALTSDDLSLHKNFKLDGGNISLSGQTLNIGVAVTVNLDAGTISLSNEALNVNIVLGLEPGHIYMSGQTLIINDVAIAKKLSRMFGFNFNLWG